MFGNLLLHLQCCLLFLSSSVFNNLIFLAFSASLSCNTSIFSSFSLLNPLMVSSRSVMVLFKDFYSLINFLFLPFRILLTSNNSSQLLKSLLKLYSYSSTFTYPFFIITTVIFTRYCLWFNFSYRISCIILQYSKHNMLRVVFFAIIRTWSIIARGISEWFSLFLLSIAIFKLNMTYTSALMTLHLLWTFWFFLSGFFKTCCWSS